MNKVFSVLGGISAILLAGSFFVKGVPQDIMRLVGSILLIAYSVYRITGSGKNRGSN